MNKKQSIYLDYAASTPIDPDILNQMNKIVLDHFYNPSEIYQEAVLSRKVLEDSRLRVSQTLEVKSSEIIFVAGGTEANNLAISGIMENFKDSNLIVSSIEHASILKPAEQYDYKIVPVNAQGLVEIDKLAKLIDQNTVLISILLVNNEIGVIQDLKSITNLIKKIVANRRSQGNSLPLYFHTDGCQALNYLRLRPTRLGVDLMSLNGSKIYGPKQSGALFVKSGTKITPIILGGGQEFNLRSGTENLANIYGFSVACQKAQFILKDEVKRITQIRDYLIQELSLNPKIKINGSLRHRVANNINFQIEGIDNEWLILKLDSEGIMVSSGSACNASKQELSHVLKAIKLSDDQIRSSIRVTLGRRTTMEEIKILLKYINKLI